MNVMLVFTSPFGGYFIRKVVSDTGMVPAALESSDLKGRIKLKENVSAMRQLEKVFNCEKDPYKSYMAGNDYFGRIQFKYTRTDKEQEGEPPRTYILSVKVYSALGSTLEEHDARYRRNKELKFSKQCQV